MASGYSFVIVPGLNNSGPDHWQSRWERQLPRCSRVQQADWDNPRKQDWVKALDRHLAQLDGPVVIVAHSLGCMAVAHWAHSSAGTSTQSIAAALLVAPPDLEAVHMPDEVRDFAPIPLATLPFPSLAIGSSDDPYCEWNRCTKISGAWGSRLVRLENAGHINGESGLGDWPEGQRMLREFLDRI